MSSMAVLKAASLECEGLLKPLILRTNCKDAARISSSVVGGSKLKRFLIFLHIMGYPKIKIFTTEVPRYHRVAQRTSGVFPLCYSVPSVVAFSGLNNGNKITSR